MVVSEMEVDDDPLADCSDEEYLIRRSKQELAKGNIWDSKTWMLTARAIYPNNFAVQFEAYTSEKSAGNVKECAKCFQVLFDKFSSEDKLLSEIHKLMKVLRRKNPEQECVEGEDKFYLDMFESISGEVQKKMIICAADKVSEPLEQCHLMLVLLKKFPEEISSHGEKLVETINGAETRDLGSNPDPLNQYRSLLVTEILPTVLNHDTVENITFKQSVLKLRTGPGEPGAGAAGVEPVPGAGARAGHGAEGRGRGEGERQSLGAALQHAAPRGQAARLARHAARARHGPGLRPQQVSTLLAPRTGK